MRQLRDKRETADALLWLAMARQKQGFPEHAARIVAAAQALREDVGCVASQEEAGVYECCREALRRQLGEAVLRQLSREGRAMTYDKAAAYAISEVPDGVSVDTPSALAPMEKGARLT